MRLEQQSCPGLELEDVGIVAGFAGEKRCQPLLGLIYLAGISMLRLWIQVRSEDSHIPLSMGLWRPSPRMCGAVGIASGRNKL